jgi:hypothetical protein
VPVTVTVKATGFATRSAPFVGVVAFVRAITVAVRATTAFVVVPVF